MELWVSNLIRTGVVLVVSVVAYWISLRAGYRLVQKVAGRGDEREARAETLWLVVRRVIQLAIVLTAILVVFAVWDFSIAPFLAVGTVLAAAVGFGAQDLVKDVIAGFFILMEDQFHVGDTITIADTTGTVEDIQLRVTVLRDVEGRVHFVPNGQITVMSNYTSYFAQPVIDIGISYDSDVDLALVVLKEVLDSLASDPEWSSRIKGEGEVFGVNKLDDSAVVVRGRITTVAEERWSVRREALRRIKKRFDAEGITIPFPQVTIHKAD
ncbi:MAG: mechanosensitive ion channel family protein [Acidimicrobiia bacterium]